MDAITAEKRIQPVRRVSLQVSINGHDASSAIDPALLDFKFADNASGKADEIRLSLHDRDGKWHGDWRPALGMDVTATLVARDWEQEGEIAFFPLILSGESVFRAVVHEFQPIAPGHVSGQLAERE